MKITHLLSFFAIIFFVLLFSFRNTLFDMYYFSMWEKKYNSESYTGAIDNFSKISDKAVSFHNIWNSFFQLGKNYEKEKQFFYFTKAFWNYKKSLKIKENPQTRKNYEYIKKLLKEKKEKVEIPKKEILTKNIKKEKKWKESEKEKKWKYKKREKQYTLKTEDTLKKITPEEKDFVEKTIESLKQQQQKNQKFFWKQENITSSNTLFDTLFENSFNTWGKKDW